MQQENRTIICVDDEMVVLNSIQEQLLRAFGKDYTIEISDSGEDALELFDELLEEGAIVPLIISDQIMPGIKGNELLRKIYEKSPSTISILLTGQADMDSVVDLVNHADLYRYIAKPWDEDDFLMTVREVLKKFTQEREIEHKNQQLIEHSEQLEEKVKSRTKSLEKALSELKKKNEDITSSINYARRIQRAILPLPEKINRLLPESFIFFSPRDIVSGDFYLLEEVEKGFTTHTGGPENASRKIIIAAADCTGHGVPGAFMSMISYNLIVETINKLGGSCDPDKILNNIHYAIHNALQQGETKTNDGMDISLCVYDPEKHTLEFAGAKNPIIYMQNGEMNRIKGDKLPIGGYQNDLKRNYTSHQIPLKDEKGTLIPTSVYLFTDGYQDQFGGPKGKKFMKANFTKLVQEIHDKPLEKQRQTLGNNLINWMRESKEAQLDDVLVMGFRLG